MTPPTYREIVLTFSSLAALIGRMMDRGGVKLTLVIECDEADMARAFSLMRIPDAGDRSLMGVVVTWRPKSPSLQD